MKLTVQELIEQLQAFPAHLVVNIEAAADGQELSIVNVVAEGNMLTIVTRSQEEEEE
ncbi:hypothetical protein [Nostoc sp. ChiVER01]|uniref:hypothetical protein n=1 Tax=Nostoc sp. ChiVER01 TaxID=3075382 RepID=UPI002AD38359|nr:hypothetical protein [Nostoc sp. ChiVER01]MDZ8227567.1 hypothetical protein [Nostoc sp. ChiVER01]